MSNARFEIFFDPDAAKEYEALDNSVCEIVDKSIEELEIRADEVGKPLGNKQNGKLVGCKEIKLRTAGIRIIFKVTKEIVHVLCVVYILTIEKRSNDFVFKVADKRYSKMQINPLNQITKGRHWKKKGSHD